MYEESGSYGCSDRVHTTDLSLGVILLLFFIAVSFFFLIINMYDDNNNHDNKFVNKITLSGCPLCVLYEGIARVVR